MKAEMHILAVGFVLLAAAGVSWADASPDLRNAASAQVQAARTSELEGRETVAKPAKTDAEPRDLRTRNISAGQSMVAVPVAAFGQIRRPACDPQSN